MQIILHICLRRTKKNNFCNRIKQKACSARRAFLPHVNRTLSAKRYFSGTLQRVSRGNPRPYTFPHRCIYLFFSNLHSIFRAANFQAFLL